MLTIGVAGVTIPGAVDCISKMNQLSSRFFPGISHPHILLDQPNQQSICDAMKQDRWDLVLGFLLKSVQALAKAGVDFVIIPANTVHRVIQDLQKKSPLPVLNMLEIVAKECEKKGYKKVGVMGTTWTMSGHLYEQALRQQGVEEVIPVKDEQQVIHDAIFAELIPTGIATSKTLKGLLQVVSSLKSRDCKAIALACTELPLALNEANCGLPVLDTTALLAEAALKRAAGIS